ncbi:MAG: holo-ACP synthase [Treponema sp.]|jgi:holo-[acyl-carrier protein] synthase|nr:holo-ACP synthase [Treponema sp.]
MLGIGVDVVRVERFKRWLEKPLLLERFFHAEELAVVLSRGAGKTQSLAARFAAKEAFGKALGTGLAGLSLKDVYVKNNENGKPELILRGAAKAALETSGAKQAHLSLSHEKDYAVAVVAIE